MTVGIDPRSGAITRRLVAPERVALRQRVVVGNVNVSVLPKPLD